VFSTRATSAAMLALEEEADASTADDAEAMLASDAEAD